MMNHDVFRIKENKNKIKKVGKVTFYKGKKYFQVLFVL